MAKNLIVEICKADNNRLYIFERSLEKVKSELNRIADFIDPEPIVASLTAQSEDPKKFPNVVIFLDGDNKVISIDEFMDRISKCKKS
jgi:hypothetical protein